MGWFHACGLSDIGKVRDENQDCFMIGPLVNREGVVELSIDLDSTYCRRRGLTLAVADGMGGHRGGARASELALQVLAAEMAEARPGTGRAISSPESIRRALLSAHQRIVAESADKPELAGMGTTIVGVLIRDGHCLPFHAGDSRLYRFRDGYLAQKTDDHSLDRMSGSSGGQTGGGRFSSVITNSLGGGAHSNCQPEIGEPIKLRDRDILLLCTDGLWDGVPVEKIEAALKIDESLAARAGLLIRAAIEAGGADNVTVVLLESRADRADSADAGSRRAPCKEGESR